MGRISVFPLKKTTCTLALLFSCLASAASAEKLILSISQADNALQVQASLDQETHSYATEARDMIVQKLKTIYNLLEPRKDDTGAMENANRFLKQQWQSLSGLLKQGQDRSQHASSPTPIMIPPETNLLLEKVGLSLFQPVDAFIEAATSIEFVVTEDTLIFPLDALYYRGRPLFLQKPVVYSFNRKIGPRLAVKKDWNGCMISDPNTASGKAVLRIKDFFPNARHFNSQETRYEDIQAMGPAEFLLICASGGLDGIELPHLSIRSWSLTPLKPRLAYFDAGKLGLSIDFMKGFQQTGTQYYVAPIFGITAGNASTKTMERFFQSISKGNSPSYAMYLTRKTLYDESLMLDNDFRWAMIQAFPFRVYRLN